MLATERFAAYIEEDTAPGRALAVVLELSDEESGVPACEDGAPHPVLQRGELANLHLHLLLHLAGGDTQQTE